jgi:hypothetical protein
LPGALEGAKGPLEEELAVECSANAAYEDYRARGRQKYGRRLGAPPKPYTPPERPQGKINPTDLDSRNVKTRGGWMQGNNARAAVTTGQIVIAAEISVNSPDFGLLGAVCDAALSELAAVGVTDTPGVLVADAGYWHQVQVQMQMQMQQIVEHGIQVLIPPDAGNRQAARMDRRRAIPRPRLCRRSGRCGRRVAPRAGGPGPSSPRSTPITKRRWLSPAPSD